MLLLNCLILKGGFMAKITYLNKTLSQKEEILGVATQHWIAYLFPCILTLVLTVELFAIPFNWFVLFMLVLSALWLLSRYKIEMVVTNKRVVLKKGLISVRTDEIKNEKIEGVSFDQGIVGRILGYGDIYFSGTGTTKLKFSDVKDPVWTKSKLEEIIEKQQKKKTKD